MAEQVEIVRDDLSEDFYRAALADGTVAWDIETSGLDWRSGRIGTCQVATRSRIEVVVLRRNDTPKYLADLLENENVTKVFHHAPFDLRFMAHHWAVKPTAVICTKIASKVLDPTLDGGEHSLMPVLQRHLGITISKDQQVSDWLAPTLTEAQVAYASEDVAHLLDLSTVLIGKARSAGYEEELLACYRYLPTRVAMDLRGVGDVFAY